MAAVTRQATTGVVPDRVPGEDGSGPGPLWTKHREVNFKAYTVAFAV